MKKMGDESPLSRAFQSVRLADEQMGASPRIEAALLAEVRSRARTTRYTRLITLATAASLTLIVTASIWWLHASGTDTPIVISSSEVVSDFLPLPFDGIPTTSTRIVRLEVPRSALDAFGLGPFVTADAASSSVILADVVIGDDGLARAVRFVRSTSHQE